MTAPLPRRRHTKLSFLERRWLLSGKPGALPYLEGGKWAQRLWREFGEIITARFLAQPHRLFRRPINWWRIARAHDPRRDGESDFDYLVRHPELLTEAERQRLRAQAQRLDRLRLRPDRTDVGAR
jgi:hypothetical protein